MRAYSILFRCQYRIVDGIIDSVVLALFFPDSPVTARFLRKDEKLKAVKRVAEAKNGIKNTEFKTYQASFK